ncbi:undecaprenol kinase [Natranaerovirga hydrolytica]|uniref:Undecaprenol kinase n=1 Tax=Natranaerovirga hydrolytica TaxID=680378 RepID=A0A4R1MY88_9FIRM|nr:diacylglycerol kinase family protein [Natranaerovirga hydrolytica]TCK98248.1 undecaprenol kinase [Natranaerovirga hydrolytica]
MKNQSLLESFTCAIDGIKHVIKKERNIKIHLILMILALTLGCFLAFSTIEFILVILTSALVIITEIINTAIERVVDLAVDQKIHPLAKLSKDIAAGAVLFSAMVSVVVAVLLYIPKVVNILL